METKRKIRKELLQIRKTNPLEQQKQQSSIICQKLLQEAWYKDCENILVYSSILGEVDLTEFVLAAWNDKKNIFFPKVKGEEMEFYQATSFDDLQTGTFQVREPVSAHAIPGILVDTTPILVPGVAFSMDGYRIGYGKGYYDKYFMANQKNKRLYPIGIAYSFQMVDSFAVDAFDYPMQTIITEQSDYRF